MRCKAFRASFTLSAAGYIAPGDPAQRRDLPLGEGSLAAQAVAQADDVGFPPGEAGAHAPAHLSAGIPQIQLFQHIVIHPNHIDEREGAIFPVAVQRVGKGQFALELALRAEIHQYFICYPHTVARQDYLVHRQVAGSRYRPRWGHRRQRGRCGLSSRPIRRP